MTHLFIYRPPLPEEGRTLLAETFASFCRPCHVARNPGWGAELKHDCGLLSHFLRRCQKKCRNSVALFMKCMRASSEGIVEVHRGHSGPGARPVDLGVLVVSYTSYTRILSFKPGASAEKTTLLHVAAKHGCLEPLKFFVLVPRLPGEMDSSICATPRPARCVQPAVEVSLHLQGPPSPSRLKASLFVVDAMKTSAMTVQTARIPPLCRKFPCKRRWMSQVTKAWTCYPCIFSLWFGQSSDATCQTGHGHLLQAPITF